MLTAMIVAALAAPGPGVSEALAKERAAAISALRYRIELRIAEARTQPVRGREVIRFRLDAPHRIVLDFGQSRDHLPCFDQPDLASQPDYPQRLRWIIVTALDELARASR